jgi:NAD(P)-dependent dehydrogenase (short-subunit alcohol dehydrogenase family)
MMNPFRDRVAVITGGAAGIGAGLARALAARGARLVLADIDAAALAATARVLEEAGAPVLAVPTDVGDRAQVEALAEAAWQRFGGAHIVCNNAGVGVFGEIAQAPHSDWEYTMRVNFWGVAHGVEVFAPRLIAQRAGGHIVNTASMAGLVGMQWLGIYCASKFAVVGLSEALARELKPHGIGVSVLCPMIVDTQIAANSERLRPPALGGRGVASAPAANQPPMAGGVIAVDDVAARVVRGIERGDLYILTHPEQRAFLRRRAERLDGMFAPECW